jgi:putative transposase
VFLKINGRLHYLWRAVDQDGDGLDILVKRRRDKKAAKEFFGKLSLKGLQYIPRMIITNKLKSYSGARVESDAECRTPPAEVSEQPEAIWAKLLSCGLAR